MSDASNADSSNVGSFQSVGDASHASTNPSVEADASNAQDQDDISSVSGVPSQGVPFALSPALVSNAIIDYRTASGSKLFKGATAALPTLFDGEPEHLQLFLAQLQDRAMTYGWEHILDVATNPNQPILGQLVNLITHYGQVTIEQVRAHAATYVNTPVRAAQDSHQLYLCCMSSLTKDAQNKVRLKERLYQFGQTRVPSGACLLKVIIMVAHVDTRATTSYIRTALSSLDHYMASVDSNIEKFNQHVDEQVKALACRGEETHDLMINLFKGYRATKDRQFVSYITDLEWEYNDGTEITAHRLMTQALNWYKDAKRKKRWEAPTAEQTELVTLKAEIATLKRQNRTAKTPRPKAGKTADGGERKQRGKGRQKGKGDDKWAWKKLPPKHGEKTKAYDGKTYHWCPHHVAWTIHRPEECSKVSGEAAPPQEEHNKKMKLAKALAAIHEEAPTYE